MTTAIFDQLSGKIMSFIQSRHKSETCNVKNLFKAEISKEYQIKEVIQDDEEMASFLFTLGCFEGESITLISVLSETYVISIKDARYSIDSELAKMILLV